MNAASSVDTELIDSMNERNYIIVELPRPMGLTVKGNDTDHGGVFVESIQENGPAAKAGVQIGDQLVGIDTQNVSGLSYDKLMDAMIDSHHFFKRTKLIFFRGSANQLYGPTGTSQKWLDKFIGVVEGGTDTKTEEPTYIV